MKKAVITGPTGGIGIFLINELIKNGISVKAICRPGSGRRKNIPKDAKVEVIECDLSNLDKLTDQIGHADVFFHMAWDGTFGPARNDMPNQIGNLSACIKAVNLAADIGCQRFIGTGSTNEYGNTDGVMAPDMPCNPNNGYGIMKYCAGKMAAIEARRRGLPFNWCRIGSAYGPFTADYTLVTGALAKMLNGERVKFTKGGQKWSFIYNGDVAHALYLVGEKGRDQSVYNIAGSESGLLRDYILAMRDLVNPTLAIGIGEVPYYENQIFNLEADISSLMEDTGYQPRYRFEEGIKETIKWIRHRKIEAGNG